MAKNTNNIRMFGGDDDGVWFGALGTTLPTTMEAPASPLEEIGWLGENGITLTPTASITKFKGHQGAQIVRTAVTESGTSFKFQALEMKSLTHGLQFNVKNSATAAGLTTMTMGSNVRVRPGSFVIDGYDADDTTIHHRLCIHRGEIGERSEVGFTNSGLTILEFTVEIIGEFEWLTTDPAFAATP